MVRDDDASRGLWLPPETGAFGGLDPSAAAIGSSTLTVDWIGTLGDEATQRGLSFLEAPVAGSRSQARDLRCAISGGGGSTRLLRWWRRGGRATRRASPEGDGQPAWSPSANHLTGTMLACIFTPQLPVELIEKDLGYVPREVSGCEEAPTIAAARGVFQRAIECGMGDDMTGVVRLFET